MTAASRDRWDAVIVGGGHNGLTAAAYLAGCRPARAGAGTPRPRRRGGGVRGGSSPASTRGSRATPTWSACSRDRIRRDLRLDIALARRRYSSYTPLPGTDRGLLVDSGDPAATAASFAAVGAASDVDAWAAFGEATGALARAVFPTVCEPLLTRSELRAARAMPTPWDAIVADPDRHHDRRAVQLGSRARRRADGCAHRHVRAGRRRDPRRQPLLPVPRDRRRDGTLGCSGRRDGRGHRARSRARRATPGP